MNEPTNTRRDSRRWVFQMWDLQPVLIPLYALILSFVVGGVLIALIGVNPFEAYWALLRGMVGSPERIAGSIARSVPDPTARHSRQPAAPSLRWRRLRPTRWPPGFACPGSP